MPDHSPRVLVAFPPSPDESLVARVRATAPHATIELCHYEEDHDRRTARGRGESVGPIALDADQARAFSAAEVALAFDLPLDLAGVAPNLAWAQAIGAGVEHWRDVAFPEGTLVTNAAGVASVPIAEFVMARLLAVWKRFDELDRRQRERDWSSTFGRLVAGRTIGIVGLGAIGTEVARRARAFDMQVIAVRRSGGESPLADEVRTPAELAAVVGRCDAVVLCAPATDETLDLFDAEMFAAMKPGSVFCNVARGSLVVEPDLIAALERDHLGAAVLDVARHEPLPADSPLWDAPRTLISPHSAASPDRYFEALFDLFADNLARFSSGRELRNVVDSTRGY